MSSIPDFTRVDLEDLQPGPAPADFAAGEPWPTNEQIPVKDLYTAADVEVTTEEMKAHYEENRDRFRPPPRVRVSQITVATEDEANTVVDSGPEPCRSRGFQRIGLSM